MDYFSQTVFNSIRFIFASKFLLLSFYIILFHGAALDGSMSSFFNKDTIRYYYPFLLIIFSIECYFCLQSFVKNTNLYQQALKKWLGLLFVYIIGVCSLHILGLKIPLWGDELYQFTMSMQSPLEAASLQHQMPLSYFQSFLSYITMGYSRLSIRFFTYFSYISFLILIFFYTFKKSKQSYLCSFLVVFLCLINHRLIYHSIDARPQALALVYAILLLNSLDSFLKKPKIKDYILFYTLNVVFLMSIGFQSLFIGFVLVLCFLLLINIKNNFKTYLAMIVTYAAAVVSFFPLQLYVKNSSPSRFADETTFSLIVKNITQLKFPDFNQLYITNYSFLFYVGVFLLVYIAFLAKEKLWKSYCARWVLFYFSVFMIFVFISFNFYKNTIDWNYKYRYASVAIPFFYICISLALIQMKNKLTFKGWVIKVFAAFFILFLINSTKVSSYLNFKDSLHWYTYDSFNLVERLKTLLKPGSTVFCLGGKWDNVYRHCSGVIMANKVQEFERKYYDKNNQEYSLYPRYDDQWVSSTDHIRDKEFAFIVKSKKEVIDSMVSNFKSAYEVHSGDKYIIIIMRISNKQELIKKIFELTQDLQRYFKTNNIKYFKGLDEMLEKYSQLYKQ